MSTLFNFAGIGIIFCIFFVGPLVFALLSHQRKMAELIHRNNREEQDARIAALEAQLRDLQTHSNSNQPAQAPELHQRLSS